MSFLGQSRAQRMTDDDSKWLRRWKNNQHCLCTSPRKLRKNNPLLKTDGSRIVLTLTESFGHVGLSLLHSLGVELCGCFVFYTHVWPVLTRVKPVSSLCPTEDYGLNIGTFKATKTPNVTDTQDTQSHWWQKHMPCVYQGLALWLSDSAWHPAKSNIFHFSVTSSSLCPALPLCLLPLPDISKLGLSEWPLSVSQLKSAAPDTDGRLCVFV